MFTSASTLVFDTFACDNAVEDGKSYLRADYSILCESSRHRFFKGYAILMILVRVVACPCHRGVYLVYVSLAVKYVLKAGEGIESVLRSGYGLAASYLL